MAERKFENGTKFETPDGEVEIVGVHSIHDRIVYNVEYYDVAGRPKSTLAEEELLNNDEISQL